eukprot:TRINITY_DN55161_c0_g1_i4.p1 TRINITY_DN55161_c0_g1~~TRINITY_DN55161_c0_g1_i4.p1  ORF type:complete len:241 (+),score=-31.86 TRINITY_DN55161_c0_g1_i4:109-723(+)
MSNAKSGKDPQVHLKQKPNLICTISNLCLNIVLSSGKRTKDPPKLSYLSNINKIRLPYKQTYAKFSVFLSLFLMCIQIYVQIKIYLSQQPTLSLTITSKRIPPIFLLKILTLYVNIMTSVCKQQILQFDGNNTNIQEVEYNNFQLQQSQAFYSSTLHILSCKAFIVLIYVCLYNNIITLSHITKCILNTFWIVLKALQTHCLCS